MELSKDQTSAFEDLTDWYDNHRATGFVTMGGYAGTGKTTCITEFRKQLPRNLSVSFCAFTGKATSVLRDKLGEHHTLNFPNDSISTIHSLMYVPRLDSNDEIIGWDKKSELDCALVIVDEASMVTQQIFKDIESYGIPIIAVGDHGQLPPVGSDFNLMEDPIIRLETPHRFMENSPLIDLSIKARTTGNIAHGEHSPNIKKCRMKNMTQDDMGKFLKSNNMLTSKNVVICGLNKTRLSVNNKIREHFGFKGKGLSVGERVICLKNNRQANVPIFNGVQGTVKYAKYYPKFKYFGVTLGIDGESQLYRGKIAKETFDCEKPQVMKSTYDCFDFGYCITAHKSQGSSWENVMIFEERFPYMDDDDWRRWIYTAITRCEKNLLIVSK
jgi:exodeoxyribonuclease-5